MLHSEKWGVDRKGKKKNDHIPVMCILRYFLFWSVVLIVVVNDDDDDFDVYVDIDLDVDADADVDAVAPCCCSRFCYVFVPFCFFSGVGPEQNSPFSSRNPKRRH